MKAAFLAVIAVVLCLHGADGQIPTQAILVQAISDAFKTACQVEWKDNNGQVGFFPVGTAGTLDITCFGVPVFKCRGYMKTLINGHFAEIYVDCDNPALSRTIII